MATSDVKTFLCVATSDVTKRFCVWRQVMSQNISVCGITRAQCSACTTCKGASYKIAKKSYGRNQALKWRYESPGTLTWAGPGQVCTPSDCGFSHQEDQGLSTKSLGGQCFNSSDWPTAQFAYSVPGSDVLWTLRPHPKVCLFCS